MPCRYKAIPPAITSAPRITGASTHFANQTKDRVKRRTVSLDIHPSQRLRNREARHGRPRCYKAPTISAFSEKKTTCDADQAVFAIIACLKRGRKSTTGVGASNRYRLHRTGAHKAALNVLSYLHDGPAEDPPSP